MSKRKSHDNDIEKEYQKLTDIQHLLKRPDTYVGQTKKTDSMEWVFNDETQRMEERKLNISPGAIKVFDEILVNARDQSEKFPDEVTQINVTANRETGLISVENNGPGIPVVMHQEQNMWLPEMLLGEFKSGSNFNDETQKRTWGGKNGIGSKATNGLSEYFQVETRDFNNGKKYIQTWKNNMSWRSEPVISPFKAKTQSGTTISFILDWKRFGMEGFEDDLFQMVKRRTFDIAACTRPR